MNVLVVHRREERRLVAALQEKHRGGVGIAAYMEPANPCSDEERRLLQYELWRLQWAPKGAPNAIVYAPAVEGLSDRQRCNVEDRVDLVARLAERDRGLLILAMSQIESEAGEKRARRLEEVAFRRLSNVLVLYQCFKGEDPGTKNLAGLVVSMASAGIFGCFALDYMPHGMIGMRALRKLERRRA